MRAYGNPYGYMRMTKVVPRPTYYAQMFKTQWGKTRLKKGTEIEQSAGN